MLLLGIRLLTLIDEYTPEGSAIDTSRRLRSEDVLERLGDLFVRRGVPGSIRSDKGPEFTATKVRDWLERIGVKTLFIEPGSPWENDYIESFNGRFRDEFLNCEIFETSLEAQVLIERWRREYNTVRPHSSLGYRPPAPETIPSRPPISATRRPASISTLEFNQRLNQEVVPFWGGGQGEVAERRRLASARRGCPPCKSRVISYSLPRWQVALGCYVCFVVFW